MGIGFKLNSSGDIDIDSSGKIQLLNTVQEDVRQRLDIQHNTWQGEWFLDTSFGVPYRQQILGKGLSKDEIDALYVSIINADEDVINIKSFFSRYNPVEREYSLRYEVNTIDALLREVKAEDTPNDEIEYPTPPEQIISSSCDVNFIEWTLGFHPTLHDDLPEGGQSTWIV